MNMRYESKSGLPIPTESWKLKTQPEEPLPLPREPGCFFWPLLLAAVLLGVYVATLLPGIGYSDTAEFQFIGKVWGTSHATGYPTLTVLNHFFTGAIPFGTQAWKSNLLSAVIAVLAAMALYRLLVLLEMKVFVAFIGAMAFGLSATFWKQALIAKGSVYELNLLYMLLVLCCMVQWGRTRKDRYFYLAAAVYAFSFGTHLTTVLLLPAILFFVMVTQPLAFINWRKILFVLAAVAVGAAQYLYIYWRVKSPGPYIYEDFDFAGFLHFVSGGEYGSLMWKYGPVELVTERLPMLAGFLWKELSFLLPLVVVGFVTFKNWRISTMLVLALLGNLVYNIEFQNPDIYAYFLPLYMVLAIYAALGLGKIASLLDGKYLPRTKALFAAALLAVPAAMLVKNYNLSGLQNHIAVAASANIEKTGTLWSLTVDHQDNTPEGRKVEAILDAVKKDAIVITGNVEWEWTNYFWYYLIGEGRGQKNNIYVMHYFRFKADHETAEAESVQAVRDYLTTAGKKFPLPQQRMETPAGLALYCFHWRTVNALDDAGFTLVETAPGLWRVYATLNKKYVGPAKGWVDYQTDGVRTNIASKAANIVLYCPKAESSTLSFKIRSLQTPRKLHVYLNGRLIHMQTVPIDYVRIQSPVELNEGKNTVRLTAPDDDNLPKDAAVFAVQEITG